jgi:hypothetical protein
MRGDDTAFEPHFDTHTREAINAGAEALATALLGEPTHRSRREWRWGRQGSFSLCRTGSKRGLWYDHERGQGGDLLDLIMREHGVGLKDAINLGREIVGGNVQYTPTPRSTQRDDTAARTAYALRLWRESAPLNGTLGERHFFNFRRIDIAPLSLDHCLRWHVRIRAIVALMTDPRTGEPIGVHRTFLNEDGTKGARKMLCRQGVICLTAYDEVSMGLGLTEGVEDGLAVLVSGWAPVWVATSAGAIARFPILAGITSLAVFADQDCPGLSAARSCCDRWNSSERETRIIAPRRKP